MNSKTKKEIIEYLRNRKLLVLSTVDENGNPWTCNVYFSINKDFNLFFVSALEAKHSQHIAKNSKVSFSVPWFDEKNLANRKAVQGTGVCQRVTNAKEIIKLLKNHYKYYPSWQNAITYESMIDNLIDSKPYIVKPDYMKFWNDELYGEKGTRELKFNPPTPVY